MGIGDWGLGIGPNPQSPIPKLNNKYICLFSKYKNLIIIIIIVLFLYLYLFSLFIEC